MAKKWAEVTQSPEFQSLSPTDQEAARTQYFDSVVAPQVPPEQVGMARQQFDEGTKKSQEAKRDEDFNLGTSMLGAAAYGVTTGVPGGKAIAAGLRSALNDKSYSENRADIENEASAAFKKHPIISGAGTLAEGAVLGGGLTKAAGKVIPALARAAEPTLVAGETAKNAARLVGAGAVGGGVLGATSGAVEGAAPGVVAGNPVQAAGGAAKGALKEGVIGAVGGGVAGPVIGAATAVAAPVVKQAANAVAAKLAPVAAPAVRSISRVAQQIAGKTSPIDNSIAILSKRLKMSPTDLKAAVADYTDKTGQVPSLAQIMNLASQRNIADIGASKNSAGDVLNAAKEKASAALPEQVTAQVAKGGAVPTTQDVAKAAAAANEAAIAPIRSTLVKLPEAAEGKADPIPPRLRRLIANQVTADNDPAAAAALENGQATVNTLDNVYQKLSDLHYKDPGLGYDALRAKLKNLMTEQVPEYAGVRSTFENSAKVKAGFKAGQENTTAAESNSVAEGKSLSDAESQLAQQGGTRRRLTDQAQASQQGALRTAQQLAEPTAAAAATPALPTTERTALQQGAKKLAEGQQALANIAPSSQKSDVAEATKDIMDMVKAVAFAGSHSTTQFKVHALTSFMTKFKLSHTTAEKLATAITDPTKTQQTIDLLRKARINEADIRDVVAQSARAAGVVGGEAAQVAGR